MSNPFDSKFTAFAKTLGKNSTEAHKNSIAAQSLDVFTDKPFTQEYRSIYHVSKVGQLLAQVVTFATTAGIGIFALRHIIPNEAGIYIALPIGLAFAAIIEAVKRSTLKITAKHILKYKSFGMVGIFAGLVMVVSIGAAIFGAKELPALVFPKQAVQVDGEAANTIAKDIEQVEKDIKAASLKKGNWIAENRTLPKLQTMRADLQARRDEATRMAATRRDEATSEADTERQQNIARMQTYTVGAAIIAELLFLICSCFILFYLFRAFAEDAHQGPENSPGAKHEQPTHVDTPKDIALSTHNVRSAAVAKRYTVPASVNESVNGSAFNKICDYCNQPFTAKVGWQRFCKEGCKLSYHAAKHGGQPFVRLYK
jgi:hypothetical protein